MLVQATLGGERRRSAPIGLGVVVGAAASLGELQGGVGVQSRDAFWARKSCLRFPLRTRGGQKRSESRRLQQIFRSLYALWRGMETKVKNEGKRQQNLQDKQHSNKLVCGK